MQSVCVLTRTYHRFLLLIHPIDSHSYKYEFSLKQQNQGLIVMFLIMDAWHLRF